MNLDALLSLFVGRAFREIGDGITQLIDGKQVDARTKDLLLAFAAECAPPAAPPGFFGKAGVDGLDLLGMQGGMEEQEEDGPGHHCDEPCA